MEDSGRLGWGRSILFASGDFACNLYWQSITFYLLFFYTETLHLPVATAGLITLIASVWDGIVGLIIGLAADRGGNRAFVRLGAVPLALAFVLAYLPVPLTGTMLALFALCGQMLFRTLYAAVNIPYSALTVRIAGDRASRSRVAGLRMVFGAAAAALVATATRIGLHWVGSDIGYAGVALVLGAAGTPLLLAVAAMRPVLPPVAPSGVRQGWRPVLGAALGDRPFLLLNLGMGGAVAAMAVLVRAVPYYYKYIIGSEASGATALALMGAAGIVAIPFWMMCATRFGHLLQWQASAMLAGIAVLLLLIAAPSSAMVVEILLLLFQLGAAGLFFGFWALLPEAVEQAGHAGGREMDALLFAVSGLVQKVAGGIAIALFGWLLAETGYSTGQAWPSTLVSRMVWAAAGLPLGGIVLAALTMAFGPWSRRKIATSA